MGGERGWTRGRRRSSMRQLTSRIALKDSFNVAYDGTPPDGVKRYDTSLEVSVIVTF